MAVGSEEWEGGSEGWIPVVSKKSAGCVDDDELIVDGGSVMSFRILNGIPGINIGFL